MRDAVVKARGLYKRYGAFEAVKGVDFAVYGGECFGFLGPNGAGKTTTMNMVQGYCSITAGGLDIFGLDARAHSRRIKYKIGVVPQENNLDPDLTVLENLRIYARYFDIPRGEAVRRALSLLEFMALGEKRDERIPMLSGGMKRRLMLARALINEPDLIMLDEPTTGLDPQARHLIWQKLRSLRRQGRTMVLTTQYMDEAAQLCDRLVVMDDGRILAEGAPDELVKKFIKANVVELSVPEEGPQKLFDALAGLDYDYELSGDTLFIQTEDREGLLKRTEGLTAGRFIQRQATLEDVFLKLTGRELRE